MGFARISLFSKLIHVYPPYIPNKKKTTESCLYFLLISNNVRLKIYYIPSYSFLARYTAPVESFRFVENYNNTS